MKDYFHLQEDLELLCPVVPGELPGDEVTGEEQLKKIEKSYQVAKKGKDAPVIMGSQQIFCESDSPYLPDGDLIHRFQAPVLLIDKFQGESMSMYSVLAIDSFLKERVKLVIINQIPPDRMEAAYRKLVQFFQRRGSPSVFLVPQDRILGAFTVRNIVDMVQGNVLTGENLRETRRWTGFATKAYA